MAKPKNNHFLRMIGTKLARSERVLKVLDPEPVGINDPIYGLINGFEIQFFDDDDYRWVVRVFKTP